jgi:hypothetical protein
LHGPIGREHPVRPDDFTAVVVTDDKMITELVEVVDVQARLIRIQGRAQFPGENLVSKPLCGKDFCVVMGDEQGIPGCDTRLLGTDEDL